jgi:hypothetical protein
MLRQPVALGGRMAHVLKCIAGVAPDNRCKGNRVLARRRLLAVLEPREAAVVSWAAQKRSIDVPLYVSDNERSP